LSVPTSGSAIQQSVLTEGLHDYRVADPSVMVIFGATGDLSSKKLLPALYNLAKQRLLPAGFAVVGAAIDALSDDQFRKRASDVITAHSRTQPIDQTVLQAFLQAVFYNKVDFGKLEDFKALSTRLEDLDNTRHTNGNRVYYCATPPPTYETITEQLKAAGLVGRRGFDRIVVEKPFGSDLKSAVELSRILQRVFHEDSVFRIDHYLGKETVQNILAFRFANSIFEPIWNTSLIDSVQITAAEEIGVELRGGYYDKAGTLRDIVQNHALQLVALVAMEPPVAFDANAVRDEKVKVLRAIPRFDAASTAADVVRGQYAAGWIAGEQVPGYREEPGVDPGSRTDTFVAMRLTIENWRWEGTPFYLRTGKRLPRRATEVAIQFKPAPHLPFPAAVAESLQPNLLVLRIQPDEGASLRFLAKVPGSRLDMRVVSMDFAYGSSFLRASPEAYERLLLDALLGDSTLFARWDEVERAWEVLEGTIEEWAADPAPLAAYEAGTWGPPEADALIARDGREWRRL
jgi:glucose-6-phosphate 1-dehydrogenase